MSRVTRKLLGRFGISKNERDESTSAAAELDEEMEKVFSTMSEDNKFDIFHLSSTDHQKGVGRRQFIEKEYDSAHRKRSYPHIHVPLKSFRSHSSGRNKNFPHFKEHSTFPTMSGDNGNNDDDNSCSNNEADNGNSDHSSQVQNSSTNGGNLYRPTGALIINDNEEPLISERAAVEPSGNESISDRKVQFNTGELGDKYFELEELDEVKNSIGEKIAHHHDHKLKRKHSGHHKKQRRRMNGDYSKSVSSPPNDEKTAEDGSYQFILQLEEPLQEFIQDDMTSHRFDFGKDKRRFSARSGISSVLTRRRGTDSSIISSLPIKLAKKYFDHSPHEVFVQLDRLCGDGDEKEWKESARWIKYEEDVEEGAGRWGKPHVASLSFHSLLNLRRCLENGVILMDIEEKELPGIAYRIVEQMSKEELIDEEEKAKIMRAMLLKHKHVNEHERFRFIRRNTSSYSSLQGLDEITNGTLTTTTTTTTTTTLGTNTVDNLNEDSRKPKFSITSNDLVAPFKPTGANHEERSNHVVIDVKEETMYSSSNEDLFRRGMKEKESILKRIPEGAEASTVFVGAVDFLNKPVTAFVRLAEAIYLPAVTEVSIPVRFIFLLLGPQSADVDYFEIGRSISTLMSNSDFNKKAYIAGHRRELLSAINDFLDYSIVVPPGNWEREALISLRELKAKNDAIRRRRSQVEESPILTATEKVSSLDEDNKKIIYEYDPLRRTKKPFGGLINDVKRRFPYYKSDFIDGFNCLCFSAAIFMYFAALSAAITFGGLIAGKTENMMGISETLIATSFAGVIFALLAGQPLLIIGTTGPLLLFDQSLFSFCLTNNIEYLTMRLYVGIWLFVLALLIACVEGSVFIKVFTRFTEEIFSSLISLIYIFESVTSCIMVYQKHPLLSLDQYFPRNNSTLVTGSNPSPSSFSSPSTSHTAQPNTALFCTILSLGTFFLAYYLRHFRNSKFLGRSARRALGDFGVPIAIVVMVLLAALNSSTYTERLSVPEGLSPSKSEERGWLISPFGTRRPFQIWAIVAAIIPAILVYILLFMETNISELIIGKKERKLEKGNGFHWDIVLVCFTNVACGLLGAPWMCAATVRSVTHVSSVTVMSRTHAPGEKSHIIQVKEQRVSALLVSMLVGLSVLMARYLRFVPMAVLFGIFLYMGISSINGVQFFDRLKLFLIPVKHHPEVSYVRKVKTMKMHLFTGIQLLCLVILWIIKSSSIALTLPFFLLMMVPLRSQLNCIFTPQELRALDGDEACVDDKEEDEPDFYEESVLPG